MAEEIFDIVDENDRVVGRAPRSRVHAERLRHRAVHVIVSDSAGRVYLQKRAETKDMHPGVWDSSCSGHLAAGEGYAQAAVRELAEELGIATNLPPIENFAIPASEETGNEFIRVFTCKHDGPVRPDPVEISEGRWLEPAGIDSRVETLPEEFSPTFRLVWRLFRVQNDRQSGMVKPCRRRNEDEGKGNRSIDARGRSRGLGRLCDESQGRSD